AVVWQSAQGNGTDTSGSSIQGQRYDAYGSPVGTQFQVNTYTTSSQYGGSAATDVAGAHFVVAWASYGSAGSDTAVLSAQAQRYRPEPAFAPGVGAALAIAAGLARRRRENGRV